MRPLQQSLALTGAAKNITRVAVGANLTRVAGESTPALDLDLINIRYSSAVVIAAIPLEPATWIRPNYPAFFAPST